MTENGSKDEARKVAFIASGKKGKKITSTRVLAMTGETCLGDISKDDDSTPANLSTLLQRQKNVLKETGRLITSHSAQREKRKVKPLSILERAAAARSPEEKWAIYIDTVPDTFFTSRKARCLEETRVRKGQTAYEGLQVNERNCEDMKQIFDIGYKTKVNLGQSVGSYDQLRIAIGQFCRFGVSFGLVSADEIWKEGSIFKLISSMQAANAFLQYFQIRGANGTVMCKANHLSTLAKYADMYFSSSSGDWARERGAISAVTELVRGVARAHKFEARKQARKRRYAEMRLQTGRYILPHDFSRFREASKDTCRSMMKFALNQIKEDGKAKCVENRKFRQKWALNFLVLLMLYGGGQRPQVFTLLERPEDLEVSDLLEQCRRKKCFEVKLDIEKRLRSIDLPHVLLPKTICKMVCFHIKHILPEIYLEFKIAEGDDKRRFLLLNTRDGELLRSCSVTSSFRTWIKDKDPDFGDVTTMTLRASFATMMVQRHRQGKLHSHLSQDDFVIYLAKLMNTSEEQLKQTYITSEHQSFSTCAAIVAESLLSDDESGTESEFEF